MKTLKRPRGRFVANQTRILFCCAAALLGCGPLSAAIIGNQAPATPVIAEITGNSRTWEIPVTDAGSSAAPRSVKEMATGMNYFDANSQSRLPSNPSFVDTGNGFIAN